MYIYECRLWAGHNCFFCLASLLALLFPVAAACPLQALEPPPTGRFNIKGLGFRACRV